MVGLVGNLAAAVLQRAAEVIAAEGPQGFSLRSLAADLGVSHTAPRHHFGSREGVLNALATQGYDWLADRLRRAREQSGSFLDVGVAYTEDLAKVRRVLMEVAHDVWEDEEFKGLIIEEPEVWGVEALNPDGVTVRVTLKTAPLEQWAVAREMRQRIKARFDYEGIEIPFPQRMIWHRDAPVQHTDAGKPAAE